MGGQSQDRLRFIKVIWLVCDKNALLCKVVLVLTQPRADSCVDITAQESVLPFAEH